MNATQKLSGVALAIAAAGMLMTTVVSTAQAQEAKKIHCEGVNACKGHNDCKTASNACKGQGSCKGQGFVAMTADQCKQIGGKVESAKK